MLFFSLSPKHLQLPSSALLGLVVCLSSSAQSTATLLVPGSVTPSTNGFSTTPSRGVGALAINTAGNREETVNEIIEPNRNGNTIPGFGHTFDVQRQILTLNETHLFGAGNVNEARLGFNRIYGTAIRNAKLNPIDFGIRNGVSRSIGLPQINVTGGLNFGGPVNQPAGRGDTTFVLADTVSYLRGKHAIKFGGEGRQFRSNNFALDTGRFNFVNISDFLAGAANSFSVTPGDRSSSITQGALNLFAQDNFKWQPNFTLELGLRFEWNITPTERFDRLFAILFKEPTFWQRYKSHIVGLGLLFLIQTLLIAGLLIERARRWRATRGLAESEERYRNVIETQTELICRYLPDTTLTFVNDAYCRYFQKSREDLIGSRFLELIPPHAREATSLHVQSLIDNPRTVTYEHEVIGPDGKMGWHQWTDHVIFDSSGEAVELQGIGRDITERKTAELALRETEERNRAILRAIPDLMFLQTKEGVFLDYHAKDPSSLLVPPEQFLGKSMHAVLPEPIVKPLERCFELALSTGETQVMEYDLQLDGERKWYEARVAPCNGNKVLSVVRDITERKRAEEWERQIEERYRDVVETQTELICRFLPDTTLTFVNEAYCRYFGKSRDELIGMKFIELVPEYARPGTMQYFESLAENPRTEMNEHEVLLPNGETGWHQWVNHVISHNGSSIELQGIGRDITDRKRAQEALRESEEFNRRIVESSTDCIKILDLEGNLLYMSPRGQQLLEISNIKTLLNKSWIDLWPPESKRIATAAVERARLGDIGSFQSLALTMLGKHRWWDNVITPIRGASGNIERLLAVSRDITAQKEADEAIRESEQRFTKAFKANPQPMSLTTLKEGRYLDVNESFLSMSGYTYDEVIGHTSYELRIWETPWHRAQLVAGLKNGGAVRNMETTFRTKSGKMRVLLSSAELLELGGQECILVASSDITERKSLEEELRLSEREFSTLVQNSPDVISRLDRNLRYIYISPTAERNTGICPDYFIGKTPGQVALKDYDWRAFETSCRQAFLTGKTVVREYVYAGRNYWTRIIPEFTPDGAVESVMAISEDVTNRLRQEKELLELTVRLFNIQDEERRRIARELHDGTAQNLFAISINLAKLGQFDSADKAEVRQLIDECQALGDQSLQEIRTLSYLLHPPLLDQAGLVSALQWYVEGFSKRSGIYVDVMAQPIGRLNSDIETALFRVVQEALTNVRRHSGSETASIRLERRSNEIVLEIKDRGNGLHAEDRANPEGEFHELGVGIPGMRQRLRQLGGRLEITSNNSGTAVAAIVPLSNGASYGAYSAGR